MRVELIYTGRSGRFVRGRIYKSTWTFTSRGGSRSPSTWVFKIRRFRQYRVMPYEFKKYWKFKDEYKHITLSLCMMYSDMSLSSLIFKTNPLLEIARLEKSHKDHPVYYPIPLIYPLETKNETNKD